MMTEPPATLIGLPDRKVDLAGSPELPVVINRSGRNIIGYVLRVNGDTGVSGARLILYVRRLAREPLETVHVVLCGEEGLIPAARSVHPVNNVSLDAVVFSDGEFAGPDTVHLFDHISQRIDATREFALQALDDMGRIEAIARSSLSRFRARIGSTHEEKQKGQAQDRAAEELYQIQESGGIEAARQAAERLSKLPKLWRGDK